MANDILTIEERLERLEKLYEKSFHEMELLSIYIPRLTDILIKYWKASGRYHEALKRDYDNVTGNVINLRNTLKEIQSKKKDAY